MGIVFRRRQGSGQGFDPGGFNFNFRAGGGGGQGFDIEDVFEQFMGGGGCSARGASGAEGIGARSGLGFALDRNYPWRRLMPG